MKKYVFATFILLVTFYAGLFSQQVPDSKAQAAPAPADPAPANPNQTEAQCIGAALSQYMKTVLDGTNGLPNIKIISPEFNLTNPLEFDIFYAMKSGAGGELFKQSNYPNFFGFIGNTYTLETPGNPKAPGGVTGAYAWYGEPDITGMNWIGEMVGAYAGTKMIFGEFGDFRGNATHVSQLAQEFNKSVSGGLVGINLFAAMVGSNPEFPYHNMSNDQINQVTGGNASVAGENPGFPLNAQWPAIIKQAGIANGWIEMIAYGPGDVQTAVEYVNAAHAQGYNPIIRACVGQSCGFAEPGLYVQFIRQLSAQITGPVWIIAGPNEPATEHWAAPGCTAPKKPFKLVDVPCDKTYEDVVGAGTPDFHSLRPYPASPCKKEPENTLLMCGQDLVVKDVYEFTDTGNCDELADGTRRCHYEVTNTTAQVKLGLNDATFPIMGNTEAVPNSTNGGASAIDFKQRVNEYVSWYLNGIPYRAEETPENFNSTINEDISPLERIVTFGGPLKRLLPQFIQTTERRNENGRGDRHNQTAACGSPDNPQKCYTDNNDFLRISQLAPMSEDTKAFPYLPFSSTEDLVGTANSSMRAGFPSCGSGDTNPPSIETGITCADYVADNSTRDLYFAHIQEDNELGLMLQNTFKPNGINDAGTGRTQPLQEQNSIPYCQQVESRTNPGDKLYGELVRPTDVNKLPIQGTLTYSANFTCDFPPVDPVAVASCVAACSKLTGDAYTGCVADCNHTSNTCQREVYIPFSVNVEAPDLTTTWERFVDGSMSIFKRIFPQVGPNTPVDEIKDIPGKSGAAYSSTNTGGSSALITSTTLAGDPSQQRPGSSAEIYFPHIGSVYDYFLKDIQKALRPKGIEDVQNAPSVPPATCTITKPNMPVSLLAIIAQAAQWAHIPAQLLTTVVEKEGCGSFGSSAGLCGLTDVEVNQYSAPGAQYPRNCRSGISQASGPTQIINGIFQSGWGNAVNLGTGENRTPNNCNIKDSIFAAAWILSAGYPASLRTPQLGYNVATSPAPSSWTLTDMERALTKWVNGFMDNTGQICITRPALLPAAACFAESYCAQLVKYNTQIQSSCNTPGSGTGVTIPAC